ncbi:MAG: outer membrane protein assembly factor BamE [Verrucomicrobiota bacterium]|jgi:outer membrane protein assembly factor BamE (lipoprotein component of BamABCDE complex)
MKKHLVFSGLLALILFAGFGCSTTTGQKLNQLDLGMSQAQVKKILGDNYIAKASTTDTNGVHLQLWVYTDKNTQEAYRVYFKDGRLAQWGSQDKLNFPELNLPK